MNHQSILSFILLLISPLMNAEPVIIHDSGLTQLMGTQPKTLRYQFAPPTESESQGELNPFPVSTPSMTPGRVHARRINRPYLNQPIFIVGADPLSITWLIENRAQLKQHHATGIAVNVSHQQALDQLVQASGGLSISPMPGLKISRQLSLQHYPALVSATRIEQ